MTCHVNYQLQKTLSRRHKSVPESLKEIFHSSSNPFQDSKEYPISSWPFLPFLSPPNTQLWPMQPLQPKAPKDATTKNLEVVLCRTMQHDKHGSHRLQPPMGMDFTFSTQDVSVKASCPVWSNSRNVDEREINQLPHIRCRVRNCTLAAGPEQFDRDK